MGVQLNRENNFDLIRLFAALQVLIVHAYRHFGIQSEIGNEIVNNFLVYFPGVPIFFFISGYLVYASASRLQPNWKRYARNRALRIFPAIWVALLLTLLILVLLPDSGRVKMLDWISFVVAQATFFQAYAPDSFNYFGVGTPNGSLWTISIELQLYLLLPFVFLFLRRLNRQKKLLFLVVAIYGSHLLYVRPLHFFGTVDSYVEFTALPHLRYFLLGVLLFEFKEQCMRWFEGKFGVWILAYVVYRLFLSPLLWKVIPYYLVDFIGDYALVGVLLSAAFTTKSLAKKWLRGNDLSYGIYIYHMLVINTMLSLFDIRQAPVPSLLLSIIFSVFLAYLSWRFVESKALKLKRSEPWSLNTKNPYQSS